MNEADTKQLIRSLVSSYPGTYRMEQLLIDFMNETGCKMPKFHYQTHREYLRSITDVIKITGEPPSERIELVRSNKSAHVVSLVNRQTVPPKKKKKGPSKNQNLGVLPKPVQQQQPTVKAKNNCNLKQKINVTMKVNETKALIQSLVSSCSKPYTINHLLIDFESVAGCKMPKYHHKTYREYLESLTDVIKITGQPPSERIEPVRSEKSFTVVSLNNGQTMRLKEKKTKTNKNQNQTQAISSKLTQLQQPTVKAKTNLNTDPKSTIQMDPDHTHHYAEDQMNSIMSSSDLDYIVEKLLNDFHKKTGHGMSKFETKVAGTSQSEVVQEELIDPLSMAIEKKETRTSPALSVNDQVKNKLKKLMEHETTGVWCCDLLEMYCQRYNAPLCFTEFGFTSLMEMVVEMDDVFRYVRPGNGDWLLFDASKPPSKEETEALEKSKQRVPERISENLKELIRLHNKSSCNGGIYLENLLVSYYKNFKEKLDIFELGFPNVRSLLEFLNGRILTLHKIDNRWVVKPLEDSAENSKETALLPITPDDFLFTILFPPDALGPKERLPKLYISEHLSVGDTVEVSVAEVWSPGKFFVYLYKFKNLLNELTDKMQNFYRDPKVYNMPDATIQPGQVCAVYSKDVEDEWERGVITEVLDESSVIVKIVDFGTSITIDKKCLRFLHRDFAILPKQSFLASVHNLKPKNGDEWPVKACERFLDIVREPYVIARIAFANFKKQFISGEFFTIADDRKESISKILISEGLASFRNTDQSEMPKEPDEISLHECPFSEEDFALTIEIPSEKLPLEQIGTSGEEEIKEEVSPSLSTVTTLKETEFKDVSVQTEELVNDTKNTSATKLPFTNQLQNLSEVSDMAAIAFYILKQTKIVKDIAKKDIDLALSVAESLAAHFTTNTFIRNLAKDKRLSKLVDIPEYSMFTM